MIPLKDHELQMLQENQIVYKVFTHPRFSNGNLLVMLADVDVIPKKDSPIMTDLRRFGDVFSFGIEKAAYEILNHNKVIRISKIPGSPIILVAEKALQQKSLDKLVN